MAKQRQGFVSNSSSSSFIVALNKKPSDAGELMGELFPTKLLHQYDDIDNDKYTAIQIADQVYGDISSSNSITKDELTSALYYRYFISNGEFFYAGEPYFGTNKILMDKLLNLSRELDTLRDKWLTYERTILKENFGIPKPYAYDGGIRRNYENNTERPYTKEEIDVYNTYTKQISNFKTSNKDYIKKHNAYTKKSKNLTKKIECLYKQLASADATAFMNDNKSKFIFSVSYSDNDGEFMSYMEHGGIFDNVNHIRISHH